MNIYNRLNIELFHPLFGAFKPSYPRELVSGVLSLPPSEKLASNRQKYTLNTSKLSPISSEERSKIIPEKWKLSYARYLGLNSYWKRWKFEGCIVRVLWTLWHCSRGGICLFVVECWEDCAVTSLHTGCNCIGDQDRPATR